MLAVETTQFILVRSQISPTLKTDCSIDFIDNDYELDIGLQRDRLTQHRPRQDRLRLEETEHITHSICWCDLYSQRLSRLIAANLRLIDDD